MLSTDETNSFVMFLYADQLLQWTLHNATVGYDTQNRTNFFNVPESGTIQITNITRTSNIDIPGIWMFQTGKDMCTYCDIVYMYIVYKHPLTKGILKDTFAMYTSSERCNQIITLVYYICLKMFAPQGYITCVISQDKFPLQYSPFITSHMRGIFCMAACDFSHGKSKSYAWDWSLPRQRHYHVTKMKLPHATCGILCLPCVANISQCHTWSSGEKPNYCTFICLFT